MTADTQRCFHCDEAVPKALQGRYARELLQARRTFCCLACRSVAESIVEAGLERFYHHREAPGALPVRPAGLLTFEPDDSWAGFIREANGVAHLSLAIEGLHCAACTWLIEHRLKAIPGVEAADVQLATHRLRLAWQPTVVALGTVLAELGHIGYAARPWRADEAAEAQVRHTRTALRRLGVAGILWFQVMMATMATWPEFNLDLTPALHTVLRWVGFFLATPIVFYSCAPFFKGAARALRARQASMDLTVALAIGGAYGAGIYTTVTGQGELYFDAVGMFAFFLLAGRYLEARVRQRAAQGSAQWAAQLPASCLRIQPSGQADHVLLSTLRVGDHVRIPPGSVVPADGVVVHGQSRLDESLLTGEFMPCPRGPGERVSAGTLNLDQRLDVCVQAVGEHSQLSAISRLLEQAQANKPALARLADRAARVLLWVSLGAALVFGAVWWWLDKAQAPWVVLALLVATCPCALSLATPTALTAALSTLQRRGLLITRGAVLETLTHVDTLLLDKTGTLTEGRPCIAQVVPLGSLSAADCSVLASALQQDSGHTLSHAFAPVSLLAQGVQAYPGQGLEGKVQGRLLRLGAADWVCQQALAAPDDKHQWLLLADHTGPLAWFGLDDRVREDAPGLIAYARKRGWRTVIASGDRSPAVKGLAHTLGIEAFSGLLPADKLSLLARLQAEGRTVLVVGDGSNDAPILAQADVGIAMGQGTDLAHTQADAVVLSNRLGTVIEAVDMATRCRRVILQNLAWAALYNGLMLPFAAMALVTPAWAAIGMSASSLMVALNALRLNRSPEAQP